LSLITSQNRIVVLVYHMWYVHHAAITLSHITKAIHPSYVSGYKKSITFQEGWRDVDMI